LLASLCALAGAAVALGGCGASQIVDPVARAATVTLDSSGYKIGAVMSITGGPTPLTASVSGAIDTDTNSGTMTVDETVRGQRLRAPVIFSGLNVWMKSSAVLGAAQRAGGKPWLYVDMSKALGSVGITPLSGTNNPSQFLGYLHAVGASPTRVGAVSINGVKTTEYRAVVNLNNYAEQNNLAAKSISSLESALGGHSLPVQAWIDSQNRVRRIHVAFPECVGGNRLQFSMTMGIYDFGSQPQAHIPSRSTVYNLTSLLAGESHGLKLGCSSAG
jgi:hypothetical protein